uniref:(northern house mosquito) hypothetical protein n=1 Tax=Culex pipiens TaxID=7175 RepID=A0A8D8BEZ4_CULPI
MSLNFSNLHPLADNSRSGGIPTGKSSPRPQKRSTSTNNSTSNSVSSERSSPSLSPRKTMVNNAVNNQHSRQPKQQHSVQATPPDGGSSNAVSSDEDSEAINIDKLKTIRNKVAQQSQVCQAFSGGAGKLKEKDCVDSAAAASLNNQTTENSAILIQKIWRGYMSRKRGQNIADILQKKRTQDYIVKLTKDMEMTKTALENERKIQQLQMQAINALWKKVSAMQPSQAANGTTDTMKLDVINNENSSVLVVQDLTKTCSMLMNQVQQLQTSVKDIVNCMQFFANMPQGAPNPAAATLSTASEANLRDSCETQTEIVAVHTPQVEQLPAFPFRSSSSSSSKLARPSTLPISSSETSPKITSQDGQPIVEETEAETKEEVVVEIEADPGDTEENDDGEQKEQDEKELQEEEEVVAVEEEPSESQN